MTAKAEDRPDLTYLATERLVGERTATQHADLLLAVLRHPEVAAWLGGEKPEPELRLRLERWKAHWEEHGFGTYVLRQKGTASVVGYAGLQWTEAPGERTVELLYALLPAFQHQGYATEAATALLDLAFEQLRLDEVVAFTMTTNAGSQGVMQRVGMTYVREFDHAELRHVLYVRRRTA